MDQLEETLLRREVNLDGEDIPCDPETKTSVARSRRQRRNKLEEDIFTGKTSTENRMAKRVEKYKPGRPFIIGSSGPSVSAMSAYASETAKNNYDDAYEAQNELLGWVNAKQQMLPGRPMPKQKKYELLQKQCQLSKLPPPLPLDVFDSIDWNHVPKFANQLLPNQQFLTLEELTDKPRRHSKFPFCHPGPVADEYGTKDWFYADSIVQEVKLLNRQGSHYVVRWVGFEDEYNTVEPAKNLADTAVLILYTRREYATGARSNGCMLLRRSARVMNAAISRMPPTIVPRNEDFARAMKILDEHLIVEERADRYSPIIGFQSSDGEVPTVIKYQFNFLKNVFFKLVAGMDRPNFYLSPQFVGSMFGNLRCYDDIASSAIKTPSYLTTRINKCLAIAKTAKDVPHYVSFLVVAKHGSTETKSSKQLDIHMCVLTIRSTKYGKDAIYFDPVAEAFKHDIPDLVRDLSSPVMATSTRSYGPESQSDDCVYQCLKYIIGLHTGEVEFRPDLTQRSYRYER